MRFAEVESLLCARLPALKRREVGGGVQDCVFWPSCLGSFDNDLDCKSSVMPLVRLSLSCCDSARSWNS